MPLRHLIATFNQRFATDNQLESFPFFYDGKDVNGRTGDLTFSTTLKPVRLHARPDQITGHEALSRILSKNSTGSTFRSFDQVVCLDRLMRTVHMLNYLPLSDNSKDLFLPVNPSHLLTIKKDHGAYFEEIILRCGLPLRRIVISLNIGKALEPELPLLLERLSNYRNRGYSTAIRFDDSLNTVFLENFCLHHLHRHTADFLRFNLRFFRASFAEYTGHRRRGALLRAIRHQDLQLVVAGVDCDSDAQAVESIFPDHVQGLWYESRQATPA